MGDSDPPDELIVGTLVGGRYRIEEELGRGGMGVVYRAEHVELEQPVAVKVLTSDVLTSRKLIDRFLREARAAAAVGHRNIVRVFDLGKLPDGQPYLAMELLEGAGLDEVLEAEGALPPARAAAILTEAAAALDAIHSLGLVHRDVKPENLFVARNLDGTETVKLVDFGLVGMTQPDVDQKRLTETGLLYGTPAYLAPETMAERTPSPKWDVYSLAVVAFELLTGRLPMDGDNPLQLLTRRATEDPPTLAAVAGHPFPEPLEAVVRRGLSRFADARYDSAGELAAELTAAAGAPADANAPKAPALSPDRDRDRASTRATGPSRRGSGEVTLSGRLSAPTPSRPPGAAADGEDDAPVLPSHGWRRPAFVGGGVAVALGTVVGLVALGGPGDEPSEAIVEAPAAVDPDGGITTGSTQAIPTAVGFAVGDAARPPRRPDAGRHRRRPEATSMSAMGRRPSAGPSMDEPEPPEAPTIDVAARERDANRALARGNVGAARSAFREIVEAAPGHASAWRGLGVAAERLGRSGEARHAYERYLALAPGAADAASVRARLADLD